MRAPRAVATKRGACQPLPGSGFEGGRAEEVVWFDMAMALQQAVALPQSPQRDTVDFDKGRQRSQNAVCKRFGEGKLWRARERAGPEAVDGNGDVLLPGCSAWKQVRGLRS